MTFCCLGTSTSCATSGSSNTHECSNQTTGGAGSAGGSWLRGTWPKHPVCSRVYPLIQLIFIVFPSAEPEPIKGISDQVMTKSSFAFESISVWSISNPRYFPSTKRFLRVSGTCEMLGSQSVSSRFLVVCPKRLFCFLEISGPFGCLGCPNGEGPQTHEAGGVMCLQRLMTSELRFLLCTT